LIAVYHLEAHALTPRLTCPLAFPYCLFLASGGHTQIVAVVGVGKYVRLGTTVDDAMGEAFDKVAKMLSLPYPGGPEVERAAAGGNPKRFAFPRPMLGRPDANFSLSGLKTAVRNEASRMTPLEPQDVSDLCASFQAAVLESTADRLSVGLRLFHEQFGPPRALVAAGGVAANHAIRGALQHVAAKAQTTLIIPPPALCTDNGAMIAWAGAERLALGLTDTMDAPPRARWLLDANATAPAGYSNTRAGFRHGVLSFSRSDRRWRLWHRARMRCAARRPRRRAVCAKRRERRADAGDANESKAARRETRRGHRRHRRHRGSGARGHHPAGDACAEFARSRDDAGAVPQACNTRRRLRQGHRARHPSVHDRNHR
jgi:hypothetical protein